MSEFIIGSDEVGYGAWSGPLYVCALVAPKTWKGPVGLTDSKALSHDERWRIYRELTDVVFALATVDNVAIDACGVKHALLAAHAAAIKEILKAHPDADVIVDGVLKPPGLPQARCIPKADALFPVVSAASIVAKVNRDYAMREFHKTYPYYGFDTGVGYGTKEHQRGIETHGICPLHRVSYRPIQDYLARSKKRAV